MAALQQAAISLKGLIARPPQLFISEFGEINAVHETLEST
jgi:hypothetical protein